MVYMYQQWLFIKFIQNGNFLVKNILNTFELIGPI